MTLVAGDGDEAFPVHRAMMASSSDYFKAMFTGESTKPDQNICSTVQSPFAGTSSADVFFVLDVLFVGMTRALIALFLLPSCTVIASNAFYIHEHFNALTQVICSLVAVILPPGKLLKLTLCPHPSSIVCHCCAFMFMVLCTCNDCKCNLKKKKVLKLNPWKTGNIHVTKLPYFYDCIKIYIK